MIYAGKRGRKKQLLLFRFQLFAFLDELAQPFSPFGAAHLADLLVELLAVSLPGGGPTLLTNLFVELFAVFVADFRAAATTCFSDSHFLPLSVFTVLITGSHRSLLLE